MVERKKIRSASRPTNKKKTALGDWQAFGLTLGESKKGVNWSQAPPRSGAPTELFDVRIGRLGWEATDWQIGSLFSLFCATVYGGVKNAKDVKEGKTSMDIAGEVAT